MSHYSLNRSIHFFDSQFKRQIASNEFDLNPFEQAILPYVRGDVIDLGCGLGNLSLAAASQSRSVLALDASTSAIEALQRRASDAHLPVKAETCDLAAYEVNGTYDTVLCIGLLMFLSPKIAYAWLDKIQTMTRPGGIAAINVLIEGTTYLDMFESGNFTLFPQDGLQQAFQDWLIEFAAVDEFIAPGGTLKLFSTMVARKRT